MAQGERGATISREDGNISKAKYFSKSDKSTVDILCTSTSTYGDHPRALRRLRSDQVMSFTKRQTNTSSFTTETTLPPPQALRSHPRTLRHPTRRLHANPAHRAPQRRPSRLRDPRARRRSQRHALRPHRTNTRPRQTDRPAAQRDHEAECGEGDEVPESGGTGGGGAAVCGDGEEWADGDERPGGEEEGVLQGVEG